MIIVTCVNIIIACAIIIITRVFAIIIISDWLKASGGYTPERDCQDVASAAIRLTNHMLVRRDTPFRQQDGCLMDWRHIRHLWI
jgi:hypothetical protein